MFRHAQRSDLFRVLVLWMALHGLTNVLVSSVWKHVGMPGVEGLEDPHYLMRRVTAALVCSTRVADVLCTLVFFAYATERLDGWSKGDKGGFTWSGSAFFDLAVFWVFVHAFIAPSIYLSCSFFDDGACNLIENRWHPSLLGVGISVTTGTSLSLMGIVDITLLVACAVVVPLTLVLLWAVEKVK